MKTKKRKIYTIYVLLDENTEDIESKNIFSTNDKEVAEHYYKQLINEIESRNPQ